MGMCGSVGQIYGHVLTVLHFLFSHVSYIVEFMLSLTSQVSSVSKFQGWTPVSITKELKEISYP